MHSAPEGDCAFVGCPFYRPDGPRDEKWAFHPQATPEDIAAAMAENAELHARAPGTASPIHLVVENRMKARLARSYLWGRASEGPRIPDVPVERTYRCPGCGKGVIARRVGDTSTSIVEHVAPGECKYKGEVPS